MYKEIWSDEEPISSKHNPSESYLNILLIFGALVCQHFPAFYLLLFYGRAHIFEHNFAGDVSNL